MSQMMLHRLCRPHRGQARSYSGKRLPIDYRSAIGAGRVNHGARFAIGTGGIDDDGARFIINAGGAGTPRSPVGARLPANASGQPPQALELT
jgi:hypothetical protein